MSVPAGGERRQRGPLFWLGAARAPFFTGSLAPVAVGVAVAMNHTGQVRWEVAGATLLALVLLHAAANLANDYWDHLSGNDAINVSRATPFTGGSRLLQNGLAEPAEILAASLISLAAGCAVGVILVLVGGAPVLLLGAFGAVTGFGYSAPPLRLNSRGLGEAIVFVNFGVLPVLGACYLQTGAFTAEAAVAGCIVGALMANVLWINQFQDAAADAAVGKRHWVVRLGRRRAVWGHIALFALAYALIAVAIAGQLFPGWAALAFLSTPLAARAAAVSRAHYDQLERLLPANIATIACHLAASVLLAAGLALGRIR